MFCDNQVEEMNIFSQSGITTRGISPVGIATHSSVVRGEQRQQISTCVGKKYNLTSKVLASHVICLKFWKLLALTIAICDFEKAQNLHLYLDNIFLFTYGYSTCRDNDIFLFSIFSLFRYVSILLLFRYVLTDEHPTCLPCYQVENSLKGSLQKEKRPKAKLNNFLYCYIYTIPKKPWQMTSPELLNHANFTHDCSRGNCGWNFESHSDEDNFSIFVVTWIQRFKDSKQFSDI